MSHSRVLFFYSLTTLTCQFPLLLEMLIGRWTLGLIIQQLSFTLISCFVLSFFLFLSRSLPPPLPPMSLCPLSCFCASAFQSPSCNLFSFASSFSLYAFPFNCLILLFCFYLCRCTRLSLFSRCFAAHLSLFPRLFLSAL